MVEGLRNAVVVGIAGKPDVAADVAAIGGVLDDVDVAECVLGEVIRRVQLTRGRRESNVPRRLAACESAHHRTAVAKHLDGDDGVFRCRRDVENLVEVG